MQLNSSIPEKKDLVWYGILIILCAVFVVYSLGLFNGIWLDVPFTYSGDGLEYNLLTKTMIEEGWWLDNPRLGAPGSLEMYDYAIGNNLDFLVMKVISLFSSEYGVVMNIYYILTYFFTALASMFVFRYFRITYPVAVLGSLLYTFLYYHVARIGHFNLTAYYLLPLMVLVIIWIARGESVWLSSKGKGVTPIISKKSILSVLLLLLISTNAYYGFFSLLFLIIAILWVFSQNFEIKSAFNGIIGAIILVLGTLINKIPSLLYEASHGSSFVLSYRYPYEAEIWGMKLIQMLLPTPGHRISFFADITTAYAEYRPLVNENTSASLGLFGSAGLIILIFWIFIRNYKPLKVKLQEKSEVMDILSVLTIGGILIGTIGGISAIIAEVFPTIHSYNRISIFIAFFCLFAIILLIQLIYENYKTKSFFCPVFLVIIFICITGGILDQIPAGYAFQPGSDREITFAKDAFFFNQLEEIMPEGSKIFILPDIGGFPHSTPPGKIEYLDSLKPYLHTDNLVWSYPTMKGRVWDNWQAAVASSTPDKILEVLYKSGFSGLLIDGYGYEDNGESVSGQIQKMTGLLPVISQDGRYIFFNLTPYFMNLKGSLTEDEYQLEVNRYLQSIQQMPELQEPLFATALRTQRASS